VPIMVFVDDARIGRAMWALRHRRQMSQSQVAAAGGVSQSAISLIERGHVALLTIRTIRAAFAALDAGFDGNVLWRGADLDRVLDERHARLVAAVAELLRSLAWEVLVEVTFAEYGERGSIDVLAIHRGSQIALVVEVKTEIASVEETLRRLDTKQRLAPKIVFDREGWRPSAIATLLVIREGSTARRRLKRHGSVLAMSLPVHGRVLRKWLRRPSGSIRGLAFLAPTNHSGLRRPKSRAASRSGAKSSSPAAVVGG
jgi:transcriptional regulator with XRE-family HTH domain